MARSISIFNDSQFHIYFDNAKATNEVGIDAIDTYAVDSLIAYDTFVVEVADIKDTYTPGHPDYPTSLPDEDNNDYSICFNIRSDWYDELTDKSNTCHHWEEK